MVKEGKLFTQKSKCRGEGVDKKTMYRGRCLNGEGGWTVCRFNRVLGEKERVVFLRGLILQCTLWVRWKDGGF